jgi:hypothetical protein
MASIVLARRGDTLAPVDEADREIIYRLREGEPVRVEIKARRNVRRHRLYWGLMRILVQNTEIWPSEEAASDSIKIAVGHVEQIVNPLTGEIHLRPKSIAFERMEEAEFCRFLDRVIYVITERLIPGLDASDLRREVFAAIDGPERTSLGERVTEAA